MRNARKIAPVSASPIFVLDSFAVLAYFSKEPGGERIKHLLLHAKMGKVQLLLPAVNLGEVAYITERERGREKAQETIAVVQQTAIQVMPVNYSRVMAAAHIKANYSISYADAFVAAAAVESGAVVVSGDPDFRKLKDLVRVEWVG